VVELQKKRSEKSNKGEEEKEKHIKGSKSEYINAKTVRTHLTTLVVRWYIVSQIPCLSSFAFSASKLELAPVRSLSFTHPFIQNKFLYSPYIFLLQSTNASVPNNHHKPCPPSSLTLFKCNDSTAAKTNTLGKAKARIYSTEEKHFMEFSPSQELKKELKWVRQRVFMHKQGHPFLLWKPWLITTRIIGHPSETLPSPNCSWED